MLKSSQWTFPFYSSLTNEDSFKISPRSSLADLIWNYSFVYTIVKWVDNGGGGSWGPPPENFRFKWWLSCSSRQDKHRKALPQNPGIGSKTFVMILRREMERRGERSIPTNLEMIRFFKTFTLYECKILASEASQEKNKKVNTTLGPPLLHCVLSIKPSHNTPWPTSDKSPGVQAPVPPPLNPPWIRSVVVYGVDVFSICLCMRYLIIGTRHMIVGKTVYYPIFI